MNTLERILTLQEEAKVTAKTIEDATGISNGSFSKWKKGAYAPSAEAVLKLAAYFHVSTDYLFCLSDIRETAKIEKSLTDMEQLLLDTFRAVGAAGQANIIHACLTERDNLVKTKETAPVAG